MITPIVGSLLIPIAGAAIGLNVAGTPSDTLTYLGLGGATAATYGTLYRNSNKEAAYLAGASAVDCVIRITRPYGMSAAQLASFQQDLGNLQNAEAVLEADVVYVTRQGGVVPVEVTTTIKNAKAVIDRGVLLVWRISRVGDNIMGALSQIRNAVNDSVRKSAQDIGALLKALRESLPTSAQSYFNVNFAGATPPPGAGQQASREMRDFAAALGDPPTVAQEKVDNVNRFAERVASIIDTVEAGGTANLDTCLTTLNASLPLDQFVVNPTSMTVAKDETKTIQVTGGRPPYTVQALDPGSANVEVTPPGNGREIKVKGKATGTANLVVSDSERHGVPVTVTIP